MISSTKPVQPHSYENLPSLVGRPLASFRQRLNAFFIDFFFASIPYWIEVVAKTYVSQARSEAGVSGFVWYALIGPAWFVFYFTVTTYISQGAPPGKRAQGIRVVSLQGDSLTLWQCLERALGYSASALEAGAGYLQFFFHPNRQTTHDKIADTLVLSERDH